ncbi:MAG: alanine racemase [Deltaproteobacteria bacterium]|nr:alanine racemase [Deltaproteobacteria bacterium]
MPIALSWIEIDANAIACNLRKFKQLLPEDTKLMAVVKGEAYGHGMVPTALTALRSGADWLGVFHLAEAIELRKEGIISPILILGYTPFDNLAQAIDLDLRLTVSSIETIQAASKAAKLIRKKAQLHVKLETGTNRLGLDDQLLEQAANLFKDDQWLVLEGAHTHYANIEDTTEHDYAKKQLSRFSEMLSRLRDDGIEVPRPHTACSAAAILFPKTYFSMVRVGIGMYGLWPSKETYLSALQRQKDPLKLTPAMTWKTIVAQVKRVPPGEYVGYGCTYKTTRETTLAVLPIGYANGYDRLLSNRGHVLIRGERAPIRGRVCMNLVMVDVTDIPEVTLEDEVVLLGQQAGEQITAEQMADWAQTINYEIVARVDPYAQRNFFESETE